MNFIPTLDLLRKAVKGGYAVPGFCVWNAETMRTVLEVASELKSPVILMNGPREFTLLDPSSMGQIAHGLLRKYSMPAALHLDHGDSLDQVKSCIDAGYSSVMLDFSAKSFEENTKALKKVCEMAHLKEVTVEGEIGSVGKIDDKIVGGSNCSMLTDPEQAKVYVNETGVDTLAVSIGNVHGNYTKLPKLDFAHLEKIHKIVDVPLVLHGGSGTPNEDLQKAISLGISRVNIGSELVRAVRESLREQWNGDKELWVPAALTEAMKEMAKVVERWIYKTGALGRA